jgi:hypothetical protein
MGLFTPGNPRIALLDGAGNKLKTLYLPAPDKTGGVTLEWIEKAFYTDLVDGSEATRRLGWIPQMVMKWNAYNDLLPTSGRAIGAADGNVATMVALLALLDAPPGFLSASPGPSAGGFVVQRVKVAPIGIAGAQGVATGVEITLRGGAICATKTLGAF